MSARVRGGATVRSALTTSQPSGIWIPGDRSAEQRPERRRRKSADRDIPFAAATMKTSYVNRFK